MGNTPSSTRASSPTPSTRAQPRPVQPPQAHPAPPREALSLSRPQVAKAAPAAETRIETAPSERDLGAEVMPGELLQTPAEERNEAQGGLAEEDHSTPRTDWGAAAAAMERAMHSMRDRAVSIAKEATEKRRSFMEEMERLREAREEAAGRAEQEGDLRFPPGLREAREATHEEQLEVKGEEHKVKEEGHEQQNEDAEERPIVTLTALQPVTLSVESREEDLLTPRVSESSVSLPVSAPSETAERDDPGYGTQEGEEDDEDDDDSLWEVRPRDDVSPPQAVATGGRRIPSDMGRGMRYQHATTMANSATGDASPLQPKRVRWGAVSSSKTPSPLPLIKTSSSEAVEFPTTPSPAPAATPSPASVPSPARAPSPSTATPPPTLIPAPTSTQALKSTPVVEQLQDSEEPKELKVTEASPVHPHPEAVHTQDQVRVTPLPRVLPPVSPRSPVRPLEPGVYTLTDVRWGMALDLSGADHRSVIGFDKHGWENQQWEFSTLGAGYTIRSMRNQTFLGLDGFMSLHEGGVASTATSSFPMCWDMEVLTHFESNDEDEDIYARIRWPNSDLALGLSGEHPGARLLLTNDPEAISTYWRLRAHPRPQIVKGAPVTTVSTLRREDTTRGVMTVTTTTTSTTTTTKSVTRVVTTDL